MNPNASNTTTITVGGTAFTLNKRRVSQFLALETHSTPWRPAGATLARLVDVAMTGIPADGMSRTAVGASIQSISALSYLYRQAIGAGRRATAVLDGSLILAELEKLAAAGSEDASSSLLIVADMFRRDGVADDVFVAAALRADEDAA